MEILDIYDVNGNVTSKTIERGNKNFLEGEYIKLAVIWIKSNDKYLVQKCSEEKGGEYAITGGHVSHGNTSLEQIILECDEEMGYCLEKDKVSYLGACVKGRAIFDIFYYEDNNLDLSNLKFQEEEVESAHLLSKSEIEGLIQNEQFRKSSAASFERFIKNK